MYLPAGTVIKAHDFFHSKEHYVVGSILNVGQGFYEVDVKTDTLGDRDVVCVPWEDSVVFDWEGRIEVICGV